ncbi:retinol dehydrogenase 2-like [Tropilaelaps mercedesae]|uniref:Retinol dehydrogenase 2-like n=1 Tax=Tropilaelaps mercedesae TaxID=418985 RepID=A0A1V9XXJ8_9ACAR|nr:retinol dehydrogenase 2-like [Tropilaelaps mercedesae]
MSWSTRLMAWLICAASSVFLSNQTPIREKLFLLADEWHIPQWLYLLPISLAIAWIIAQLVFIALNLPRISSNGKAVFITGCDSGFGYRLSLKLSSRGYHVFAGCLFPEGSGATSLLKEASQIECFETDNSKKLNGEKNKNAQPRISVIQCDVTSEESLQRAFEEVTNNLNGRVLWAVVANAGISCYGYTEWVSMERIQKLFDVNTFGVIRTFRAFAPLLRQSRGRLIVTTSWAARFSPPSLVPYAMTKHAARALCDGLRAELSPFGIDVCSVEPNMYRTSMIPTTTKELDAQWEDLSDELRSSYGHKLLKKSRIMTQDFAYLCQDDLRFPLWCFEHAVSGRFPKVSYECDRFSMWLLSKLVANLPNEFMACFNHYIHYLLALGRNFLPGRYI